MHLRPATGETKAGEGLRLAEFSSACEYVARYGEPVLGDPVEHLCHVYPTLTERDVRRLLAETPQPDPVWPGVVVPTEAAAGRRRQAPSPLFARDREPGEGAVVLPMGYRRRLQRLPKRTPVL